MPPNTVYVGRGSLWGNPFKGPNAMRLYRLLWRRRWKELEEALGSVIPILYLACIQNHWRKRLPELRGKNLACWCPLDRPCHADILLRKAKA